MTADVCPVCTEPQLTNIQPGVLECAFCHARLVNGRIICPSCRRANDVGKDACTSCGEPLSIVGAVISRQGIGVSSQRLEQLRGQAGQIKSDAEAHSRARMTGFQEVDDRRNQSEREAVALQSMRDRVVFKYTAIGAGVFLLLVAIISLIVLL